MIVVATTTMNSQTTVITIAISCLLTAVSQAANATASDIIIASRCTQNVTIFVIVTRRRRIVLI